MTSLATAIRASADPLALDRAARELLFTSARTANTFSAEPVSDDQLRAITELAKWPPIRL
jgi:3-hydroxypropanoate dehydrogenase